MYQPITQDRCLLLVEYVSSHWQKLIQFFKVEKQLKAFPIKSVPTVAGFRTRCLGNLNGYVPVILYLNPLCPSTDRSTQSQNPVMCARQSSLAVRDADLKSTSTLKKCSDQEVRYFRRWRICLSFQALYQHRCHS